MVSDAMLAFAQARSVVLIEELARWEDMKVPQCKIWSSIGIAYFYYYKRAECKLIITTKRAIWPKFIIILVFFKHIFRQLPGTRRNYLVEWAVVFNG